MKTMKELKYHSAIKVKIYPDDTQKRMIAKNDGAKRAVYNFLVASGNEIYRLSKTAPYVYVDRKRVEWLKANRKKRANIFNTHPFLYDKEIDSLAIDNAIDNYNKAWNNQKQLHTGVPVFKCKGYEQAYQTNPHYKKGSCNVRFESKHFVTLPKLGVVRFDGSPKMVKYLLKHSADIKLGTITVSRDAVGEYWAAFQLASDTPFKAPFPKTGKQTGIDLNLIELVNDSDGNAVENMHFYKKAQDKLAKAQRKLSRRKEAAKRDGRKFYESKGYQKQRHKVAYLSRKVARQREDYLDVTSKQLVENQDLIAAEDLRVSNLMKNHKLAKAIQDAGWRTLLTKLQYKAVLYGKEVILVPPQFTTQTCSCCGYVMKGEEKLTLADREWTCPQCGTFHKRDVNAARNILNRALEQKKRTA
ncbi:MAG: transposase [Clostridiales bacterium]|nr:transposase [Clostridiales bacterium]